MRVRLIQTSLFPPLSSVQNPTNWIEQELTEGTEGMDSTHLIFRLPPFPPFSSVQNPTNWIEQELTEGRDGGLIERRMMGENSDFVVLV